MNKHVSKCIGPRVVGGRYRNGYWRKDYTVTAIDVTKDGSWRITVQWEDGLIVNHCTAWDAKRDTVLYTPAQ